AEVLSAVATRMDPSEAADSCKQSAELLIGAMAPIKDPLSGQKISVMEIYARYNPAWLAAMVKVLSAVAARMEPGEAADLLTAAVTQATDPYERQVLAKVQSAAPSRPETNEAGGLLEGMARAKYTLMSEQDLVELLKEPDCIGSARRAVLDELER